MKGRGRDGAKPRTGQLQEGAPGQRRRDQTCWSCAPNSRATVIHRDTVRVFNHYLTLSDRHDACMRGNWQLHINERRVGRQPGNEVEEDGGCGSYRRGASDI